MVDVKKICAEVKQGSYRLQRYSSGERNAMLEAIAGAIEANAAEIIKANAIDVDDIPEENKVFKDRLTLNAERIAVMCDGLRQLIGLDDPVGEVVEKWTSPAGLNIKKVRASLGVIGVIYEARPNVTADVVGLTIKTSNGVVLRGGSQALNSNRIIYETIKKALEDNGFESSFIGFIDDKDRARTLELLKMNEYVDVIIPRGGDGLKALVLREATMPVIASAGGNCHTYLHESADINKAIDVIVNAKVQRPTVCNATEQLLIDESILEKALPGIVKALRLNGVSIKGDEKVRALDASIEKAADADYYTEYHDLIISIKTVSSVEEAVDWINEHGTMHSDAILAEDKRAIDIFTAGVDSGCIYVNASTRFTDGYEFGFGAEIAISTQKLHARGPLGLRQLTSEKYIAEGDYTIRK